MQTVTTRYTSIMHDEITSMCLIILVFRLRNQIKRKLNKIATNCVGLISFKCIQYKLLERQWKRCALNLRNNCTEVTS